MEACFNYLSLLRGTPPDQMYFEEEQKVLRLGFDLHEEEPSAGDFVSRLAELVQLGCPPGRCLTWGIPSRL